MANGDMKRICWIFLAAVLCLPAGVTVAATDEPEHADVRILIDISGSMRRNDPQNLRRSALRLMVGLMPRDTRAGVWTFAQYVNMLIPLGLVDEAWKDRARAISNKISSPGQFTNIEEVLRKATRDWQGSSLNYRKNLVLLTDGMVDVSKKASENDASRRRILEELLPAIKAVGGTIHTIALSERADHELMRKLAEESGGWYEQVNDANELQRVFLRMFEKVGKPDAVPLKDNKFSIDASIHEATLLVFRKPGSQPTRVIQPDGKEFDHQSVPDNVSWHQDEGYDLLTIRDPQAGEWRIQADMDPDNRVMVVTDLKMKSSEVPNRLAVGEVVPVTVGFVEEGNLITRQDFLKVVNVTAAQWVDGEEGEARPLLDDGQDADEKAGDGLFSIKLGEGGAEGAVELVFSAAGKTFNRESRHTTQMVMPVRQKLDDPAAGDKATLSVSLDPEVLKTDDIQVKAWLEGEEGARDPLDMSGDQQTWSASIDKAAFHGRRLVSVSVQGETLSGNPFRYEPEALPVEGSAAPPPPPAPEPAPEPKAEPEPAPEPAPAPPPPVEEEKGQELDWTTIGIVIGVTNIVIILTGGLVWWLLRRQNASDEVVLIDDSEQEQADDKPVEEDAAEPEPAAGEASTADDGADEPSKEESA